MVSGFLKIGAYAVGAFALWQLYRAAGGGAGIGSAIGSGVGGGLRTFGSNITKSFTDSIFGGNDLKTQKSQQETGFNPFTIFNPLPEAGAELFIPSVSPAKNAAIGLPIDEN